MGHRSDMDKMLTIGNNEGWYKCVFFCSIWFWNYMVKEIILWGKILYEIVSLYYYCKFKNIAWTQYPFTPILQCESDKYLRPNGISLKKYKENIFFFVFRKENPEIFSYKHIVYAEMCLFV